MEAQLHPVAEVPLGMVTSSLLRGERLNIEEEVMTNDWLERRRDGWTPCNNDVVEGALLKQGLSWDLLYLHMHHILSFFFSLFLSLSLSM